MDFKNTLLIKRLLFIAMFIINISAYSQNFVAFTPKLEGQGTFSAIKGDMLLIGNNTLNRRTSSNNPNDPYNGTANNNDFSSPNTMDYIDVDADPTTFSSSSANLTIPVATSGCYTIRHASLYWGGMYKEADVTSGRVNRTLLNTIKLKLPGAATYTNIVGPAPIYDSYPTDLSASSKGYVCSADVTALVQGLANANGTYTVANLIAGSGSNTSAGWTLYIVYSDPLATAKNITLFEGFSAIANTTTLNIPITGFTTIPVGPVRAKLAFSALEGDYGYTGDRLRINGTNMTIPTRPASNFFNATINDIAGSFTTRTPNSTNLLGFDAGIINVPNPGNGVIANGDTSATVSLVTNGDSYFYYMNAFAVEIIQPNINLIKIVRDLAGNNIANGTVALGQELYYDLDFQNIGNDGATNFTITDLLPTNVDYIAADLIMPPGVTVVHDAVAHSLTFTIPNSLVTQGGANYQIRIKVRVLDDCNNLRDACSNEIRNQAFKTYSSLNSGNVVENGQPSASGINSCLILEPGTTNFLADIDDCTFTRDEILCGSNVVLTAGSGYTSYQWHNGAPPTAGNAIAGATGQSYTATALGTYSVVNTAPAPCLTITETINVIDFNGVASNPVIPYADEVDTCVNDGSPLPKIFLCGAGDSQLIQTNILNATSITWEFASSASCTASDPVPPPSSCPDTRACVTWSSAGPNGPNFNATTAGQYRVRIVYQNGCFRNYYFNVYQNLFTPTETHSDIICGTNGNITVNGVPAGYEFSITGASGPWQASNIFTITTAGTYTVYIRPIGGGVGNCIFTLPNIQIINRNFTVDVIVTNALCNNAKGSIRVQVNNVNPQYTYTLYQGATLINSVGPINSNDYTFLNLNPGTYTVNVLTTDGCTFSQTVTIINPPVLTVTAGITIPLTCNPGQITVYPVGGTPPYTYTISGTPGFQAVPEFEILTAGTYTFTVTDFNGCTATTNLTINVLPPPVFTVTQTNVLCYGGSSGAITFNVTNTNGYTLLYSIDNGVTFSSNPVFSNLAAGNYTTLVQYTLAGSVCTTVAQIITITQPATAVTASAGVSELAGCGPGGEGKIIISNPQGGVPGYQYSFNGGVTWGAINEMYLMPGTYNVCVRDTNLCVFCTNVTIDPAPPAPTISLVGPVYSCDGTGNVTATTNSNGGNYSYLYYLDGVLNTPSTSNVFSNIPCGPHDISIEYLNLTPPTTLNNLLFEDFGIGANTTSPGIDSGFCWENQVPPSTCGNGIQINEQDYVVTKQISPIPNVWNDARDHTTNGANINGRFLCVNLGSPSLGRVLYSKTINSIIPNVNVQVSLWAMTLLQLGNTGQEPNITVELVKDLGLASQSIVSTMNTGNIPKTINTWSNYIMSLNPGNNTSLSFVIKSYSVIPANEGVGVVIDDINLYQIPIVCSNTVTYPITIDCGQAFAAQITSVTNPSCNGAANGQITIAAQNFSLPYGFDYSMNGGTTWINSTTSPVTITGLSANTYNIIVRYNNAAPTCSFPFTQIITQPAVLVASASLTSPATCLTGGTITASASGGTPNYQYQLQNGVGGVLVAYQGNPVFANLAPGTYVVIVRDALGCIDPIDVSIVIPTPVNPTATVDVTSDLCYDNTSPATIVVAASGGVPPYRYSLNGGPNQVSNSFSGLAPGTYTITVTDSYGCTFTMPAITIQPQLRIDAVLISNLNCTSSPNAVISGTITGGTASYSYQVSFNASPLGASVAVVGNTFTYNASIAGTYRFFVTDAIGCTSYSQVVRVIPLPILNKPVLAVTSPIRCFGDATAAISVTNSGGLPPYTINVLNTTTGVNYGTQTSGLTAGNYTVTVTDANSCTAFQTIVINQPAAIAFNSTSVNIQCGALGTEPGSIDISGVTGGTSPYTYTVTNSTGTYTSTFGPTAVTSHSFVILNFGVYTITVVDANGCQLSRTNTVSSPPNSLTITPIIIPTTDCLAGGSIQVCVNSAVPIGPYFFAIYEDLAPAVPGYQTFPGAGYQPADITDPTGQCSTFTGLTPGVTYSFIVYDQGTNCYYFETSTSPVDTNSSMVVSNDAVANVTCTGADDGNVSFTFSNYSATAAGVSYQIFYTSGNTPVLPLLIGTSAPLAGAPVTISNFGPLAPGQYYILLTENDGPNAGCSITSANFTIVESPLELDLLVNVTKNDNCNVNAGQITVTGLDGTPAYSYQLLPAGTIPAPDAITWAGQASNVFNVEGGTYDIYIKDAFNCIRFALGVFVPTDTNPNISLSLEVSTLCNTVEGNYSIRVTRDNTVGIAPFTYSVDGSAFTTYTEDASFSFLLTGLNSGLHTVIIKDVNGCTETETITISPPLSSTVTPTIAAVQNCGASDGIITVNATGGTGTYTYSISPIVGTLSGNVFSNVPAGIYTITVTDATTLCTFDIPVTLATPDPVTFTATATDATCNTGTDGSISIALTGAATDPVYMYEITAPIVRAPQTSNVFSGLPLGNYTVVVTSGRGCTATQVVPVGEPAAVTISAATLVVTQFGCTTGNTTSNATIVVNGVTGGSGTYINYEFILGGTVVQSGTSNTYIESNPLGGFYTINVYDNNGCSGTINATIDPFIRISFSGSSVTVTQDITCVDTENITINVTNTGGIAPNLEYIVTGLGGNPYNVTQLNNPNFTGLTIGNYNITVNNLDTGCSIQTTHLVFNPNTFIVTAAVTSNVICYGSATGTATLTFIDQVVPTDEAGPFNYTVIHQGTGATVASGTSAGITQALTGLIAGVYQVQTALVATPECPAVTNFTITGPAAALSISATSTRITCNEVDNGGVITYDGTISASALNGWGAPYEFQLELGATIITPWSTVSNFTNLGPGNYTVRVRDSGGCDLVFTNVLLVIPTPITGTINVSTTALPCVGDTTASITITGVSGGEGANYLYVLTNTITGFSTAPQTSNTFNNLGAGTYEVTISDSFTCTFTTGTVSISEPIDNVIGTLAMTVTPTCIIDATLSLTASGGTAPYRYSTTAGGPYSPLPATFTNVGPGTYQYYVIDANNCIEVLSNAITVELVEDVKVDLLTDNPSVNCFEGTTTITATAINGLGNYIYTLLPTGTVNNTGIFDVAEGNYTIEVMSGDCTDSIDFYVAEPTQLAATLTPLDLKCPDDLFTGSITVTATGGSGVYNYSISTAPNESVLTNVFDNLAPGYYEILVQDDSGCSLPPLGITITKPDDFEIVAGTLVVVDEVCLGDQGSISFTITGGSDYYSYTDPVTLITTITTGYTATDGTTTQNSLTGDFDFQNLNPGEYDFIVTDAAGCTFAITQSILPGVDIQAGYDVEYPCTETVPTNILTVSYNPSILLADLTFTVDAPIGSPQASNVFDNTIAPGNHVITITHIDGCIKTLPVFVDSFTALNVTLLETGLNTMTATATGGLPAYEYTFIDSAGNVLYVGSNPVYQISFTDTYTVIVVDANGCTDTKLIPMIFYDIVIPDYFTPDGDGTNDGWGPNFADNFPNIVTYVFDRYSRVIITLRQGETWDGTYNNNKLPSGDYWYVIKLNGETDAREFVGNFTLYR